MSFSIVVVVTVFILYEGDGKWIKDNRLLNIIPHTQLIPYNINNFHIFSIHIDL